MQVYLSSSFAAREDQSESLMGLRQDLRSRGARLGVDVILGEDDPAVAAAVERNDAPGILEGCARLMAKSDAFFGMLFERHGTGVVLEQDPLELRASVSFFEAELLEASVTRKPICIVQARELRPSLQLGEFLRLVAGSLGNRIVEVDRRSLPAVFENFCRSLANRTENDAPWLFDTVSLGRIRRHTTSETIDPRLSFLNGAFRADEKPGCDEAVLKAALRRVEAAAASDGRPMGQLEKLSYLWIVIRELARGTISERLHEFPDETQRALQLWNSAAAWYGIHGSHPMGCLAAVNELSHVRVALGSDDMPLGPRSSAYYSIGTKLKSRPHARRFFKQSLALAQAGLKTRPADPSGLLQMTGSAQARLASLGERWRYFRALQDFRKSLHWRKRHRASDADLGDAMSAYAFVLYRLPSQRSKAIALAADASEILRSADGGTASGLYFRSEHRRAELLRRAGRGDEALAAAADARDLARRAQASDQSAQLDALVAKLSQPILGTRSA